MPMQPTLRESILMRLVEVIDPETGLDVLRMRLVENLEVDETLGLVRYCFRPSSPLCPLALALATAIKEAIAAVPGVRQQEIQVAGYAKCDELMALINAPTS